MNRAEELLQRATRQIDTPGHPDYGKPFYVFSEAGLKIYIQELVMSKASDEDIEMAMKQRGIRDSYEKMSARTMAKWVRDKIARI